MMFIDVLEIIAGVFGFCFCTVCLAAGLYYLAELVEEYTVMTKRVIKYSTIVVVVIHLLLLILDRFPIFQTLFSIACHGFYSLLLKDFPFISLTSPFFIGSVVLVLSDHFLWFYYFSENYFRFTEVISFFTICVWVVPFMYFISLSASDNTLPTDSGNKEGKKSKLGGHLLTFLNFILRKKEEVLPQKTTKSF